MRISVLLYSASLMILAGCIGTDRVFDPTAPGSSVVSLAPTTAAVMVGSTVSFQATYHDRRGRPRPEASIEWNSSNDAIATITEAGVATGRSEGQVMIMAESGGVASPVAYLTVVSGSTQVANITITPSQARLAPGGSVQLVAMAVNLAGEIVPNRTFTWLSDDPAVVHVDSVGLATALRPGSAGITATADGVTGVPSRIEVFGRQRTGTFVTNVPSGHFVTGTVVVSEMASGLLQVELQSDYSSSGGPGVHVFLSSVAGVGANSQDLGLLAGTRGASRYNAAGGTALTAYDHVVIHCVPYNITFGSARLGPPS